MSYEPTTWKDGDLVTSAKLNKMEQGIATSGGILVVHEDENNRLDKTWQEIYDADFAILCGKTDNRKLITLIYDIQVNNNEYYIWTATMGGVQATYVASTSDDYPVYSEEAGGGPK